MLDLLLVFRILLNILSIVYFLKTYQKIKFFGLILLSIQSFLGLSLGIWAAFYYIDPASQIYDIILVLSNIINLLAAYYLYSSAMKIWGERKK